MRISLSLLLLCIAAASSTASSFGTSTTRSSQIRMRSIRHAPNRYVGFGIRGGSSQDTSNTEESTFTALEAMTDPEAQAPYPAPEVDQEQISATVPAPPLATENITTSSNRNMGPNASTPGFLRKTFPTVPWYRIPNLLTYARCFAIPAFIYHFYTSTNPNKNLHSSLIFAIASITDYLDGYLARRWDICSSFGAFLDPVADKLMVSTALILASGKYGTVMALPTAIILAREIAVSALREWMASKGLRDSVKVGFQGKCKTALTMMALTVLLAVPDGWDVSKSLLPLNIAFKATGWNLVMNVGVLMLYMSALVTVTSGSVYFKAAGPVLLGKE